MKKQLNISKFEELYSNFMSHKTWTKEKHEAQDKFLNYLYSVEYVLIKMQHKKFPFNGIWCYDIIEVPKNQLGKLYKYRGKYVLRLSIVYSMYRPDTLICFPLRIVNPDKRSGNSVHK